MPNADPATPTAATPDADAVTSERQPERIVDWPPADAFARAEEVRERHGYYDPDSPSGGRLTPAMVTQLARIAQTIATPDALITTEPPTEGKPYTSTGLSSLQPQIDVMHAVFGPPHWRLRERELDDGVLDLELVIGNDLDRPDEPGNRQADVLLRHRMRGSHTRGRSHGDRYKGALTNGAKRLLAMAGACADVWRFGPDPDEAHNTPDAARDTRKPTDKQISFLASLLRETAGPNAHRWLGRIQQLAGVPEPPPEPITDGYLRALMRRLDRDQVSSMIDALVAIRGERAQPEQRHQQAPPSSGAGEPADGDTRDRVGNGCAPAPADPERNGDGEVVAIDFGGLGPDDPAAA
jgi:hypothetical protein